MLPKEQGDEVVHLDGGVEREPVDCRRYAGQYIAFSADPQRRVVAAADTLDDFLAELRRLDDVGEPYVVGGFVPAESLPLYGFAPLS